MVGIRFAGMSDEPHLFGMLQRPLGGLLDSIGLNFEL